jgi:hypothetical protein
MSLLSRLRCEIELLAGAPCFEEGAVRVRTVWGDIRTVCEGHRLEEDVLLDGEEPDAATTAPQSVMRCPGCDCDPVGWAPHNGQGDCPPKTANEKS